MVMVDVRRLRDLEMCFPSVFARGLWREVSGCLLGVWRILEYGFGSELVMVFIELDESGGLILPMIVTRLGTISMSLITFLKLFLILIVRDVLAAEFMC